MRASAGRFAIVVTPVGLGHCLRERGEDPLERLGVERPVPRRDHFAGGIEHQRGGAEETCDGAVLAAAALVRPVPVDLPPRDPAPALDEPEAIDGVRPGRVATRAHSPASAGASSSSTPKPGSRSWFTGRMTTLSFWLPNTAAMPTSWA